MGGDDVMVHTRMAQERSNTLKSYFFWMAGVSSLIPGAQSVAVGGSIGGTTASLGREDSMTLTDTVLRVTSRSRRNPWAMRS